MSSRFQDSVDTVAAARTVGELFRRRARATPDVPACSEKIGGDWREISWGAFYQRAAQAAAGPVELGLEVGDRISILGPTTRSDWAIYDLGGHLAGLVTVGIYPKQSIDQVRYLLEHSDSRAVFVAEEEEIETVLAAAPEDGEPHAIVPWSEEVAGRYAGDPRIVPLSRFQGEALSEEAIDRRQARIDPEDTAILIYTSSTTGPPKGVMITHANILSLVSTLPDFFRFQHGDRLISFLRWPTPPSACWRSTAGSAPACRRPTPRASARCWRRSRR